MYACMFVFWSSERGGGGGGGGGVMTGDSAVAEVIDCLRTCHVLAANHEGFESLSSKSVVDYNVFCNPK